MNQVSEIAIKDIHPKWKSLLGTPAKSGKLLIDILDETIESILKLKVKLCPDHPSKILRCLHLDPDKIKVVIINSEPYPTPGISTGLAFACEDKFQPSLNILIRELGIELGDESIPETFDGTLLKWEEQGVLLLNSSLSCEPFKAGSHVKLWEEFMAGLLTILNDFKVTREAMTSIVFVFVGKQAQMFQMEINEGFHYKIMRYHPVTESHGSNKFTGFYNEVNKCLIESNQQEINWI